MKIVVLDGYTLNPGDLSWGALEALGELTVYDRAPLAGEDEVIARIGEAEAIFTNKTPLSARVLAACPSLKYVGVLATGYNVVDIAAAKAQGVTVTNIPTYGTAAVGQFAIALLLDRSVPVKGFLRSTYFAPVVVPVVASSLIWIWFYDPSIGPFNQILNWLGLPTSQWLYGENSAMISILIFSLWKGVGYNMVLFLSGLQNIPDSYVEAARIDGAGWWRTFWRVTLPMLTPTLFFVLTMIFIGGFQVFNEVYMLTQGGPANSTRSIVLLIYQTAFRYFRMGEASVMAWVLFAVVLLVTLVQFKFQDKWVNYDA